MSKARKRKPLNGSIPQSRRFNISQVVNVSADVHPSRKGRIVGLGIKNSGKTRLYYLLFSEAGEGGRTWEATEEELIAWQQ